MFVGYRSHSVIVRVPFLVAILLCNSQWVSGANPNDEVLETLRRGIEHRYSVMQSVACTAVVEITYSDQYRERKRETIRARRQDLFREVMAEQGQEAASEVALNVPALGKSEAIWLSFSADRNQKKWRIEIVALTNNGQANPYCQLDAAIADNRGLPAGLFYRAWMADGEKVYSYDRSTREGSINTFTSERDVAYNQYYWELQNDLVDGLSSTQLEKWRDDTYQAVYLGQRHDDRWGACHEVLLVLPFPNEVGVAKLLVSPDLGFAVVRKTRLNVWRGNPETNQPARPYRGYHTTYQDFGEIADGIWCAKSMQTDWFDYQQGEGMNAWKFSNVYHSIELKVNQPVEVPTPYPFPFDTLVTDFTTDPITLSQPPPKPEGGPATPSLPEVPLQDLLDLLDQVEQ